MNETHKEAACERCGGAGGWQWIFCAQCGNYTGWQYVDASHPEAMEKLTGPVITDCGHKIVGEPGVVFCPACQDPENKARQILR